MNTRLFDPGSNEEQDDLYWTGHRVPEAGLYRHLGCGRIMPFRERTTFPPCRHCGNATYQQVHNK